MPDFAALGLGGLAMALVTLGVGTVVKAHAGRRGRRLLVGLGLVAFSAGLVVTGFTVAVALR